MAQIDPKKQHIQIEQVHLVYKPKTDSIFITSSDDDLINEDFFFEAERGTELEATLRALMEEHGLIPSQAHGETNALSLSHEIELKTQEEQKLINSSIKKVLINSGATIKSSANKTTSITKVVS